MENKTLAIAANNLSTGSLGSYIHWVNQIPMLSEDEEQALAQNLIKNNSLESARKMVMSHLRFVVRIARGYAGYGLPQADLIQEGNIGLMKAVKRFNPKVGVRLVSFAIHWIRAEIHEYIIRNWRIVKIATTKAQRKLFFNLRKAAKARGWFSESEVSTIAEELNVSPKEVKQMEMRLNSFDQSFEITDSDDDDNHSWQAPVNYLEDHSQNPALALETQDTENKQLQQLTQAIEKLDERSQKIIQYRWLAEKKATLQTLSDEFGVSMERIRQLEKNALLKMRQAIQIT